MFSLLKSQLYIRHVLIRESSITLSTIIVDIAEFEKSRYLCFIGSERVEGASWIFLLMRQLYCLLESKDANSFST